MFEKGGDQRQERLLKSMWSKEIEVNEHQWNGAKPRHIKCKRQYKDFTCMVLNFGFQSKFLWDGGEQNCTETDCNQNPIKMSARTSCMSLQSWESQQGRGTLITANKLGSLQNQSMENCISIHPCPKGCHHEEGRQIFPHSFKLFLGKHKCTRNPPCRDWQRQCHTNTCWPQPAPSLVPPTWADPSGRLLAEKSWAQDTLQALISNPLCCPSFHLHDASTGKNKERLHPTSICMSPLTQHAALTLTALLQQYAQTPSIRE